MDPSKEGDDLSLGMHVFWDWIGDVFFVMDPEEWSDPEDNWVYE